MLSAESIRWKGQNATRLKNGLVELTALRKGGHLADFRFQAHNGFPSQNVFWEAPWIRSEFKGSASEFQAETAGITGHGLCLDYFGAPSSIEAAAGLPIHGEAAAGEWIAQETTDSQTASCQWNVDLPVAQLSFERRICLANHQSVVYVEEILHNKRDADRGCHWVQHATFGPPFLNPGEGTVAASATRGITSPWDYEGESLLAKDAEFSWPFAPRAGGSGSIVDMRLPFSAKGHGFVAAVQLDPKHKVQFMLAVNWKLRLGVGYCFRWNDFPWMAIWEENCARSNRPWNGVTQARGMEFGTTPLPLGREETLRRGKLFDTPTWCVVPALGKRMARYLLFLFAIPAGVDCIETAEVREDAVLLYGEHRGALLTISARGCEDFLLHD